MSRWKTLTRSSSKCVGGKVPGAATKLMVGFRPDPLPRDVRRFLASLPPPLQRTQAEKSLLRLMGPVAPADPSATFSVFTDASYDERADIVHVGLVLDDGKRVFRAAFSVAAVKGVNPEDVAIRFAKRAFPGARNYWTDLLNTAEGSPTYRAHQSIGECHDLARAKLHTARAPQRGLDE